MAAAAAGIIAAQAALARRREEQRKAIAEAWSVFRDLATALSLQEIVGTNEASLPAIEGSLHGVACRAAIELDEQGWAHTVVTAPPLQRRAFEVAIAPSPRGALGFVKRLFGHRELNLGDVDFERAFLVHAAPPEVAPIFLTPDVRGALSALAGHGLTAFEASPSGVAIQWNGVERDPVVLQTALDLALAAARWSEPGRASYR